MSLADFHPAAARWFESRFGAPTAPQRRGWPAIRSGADVLIAAPTGSGKTLAAFLAALDGLFREGIERGGALPDETRVLYVSPLKALSNDIQKNLEEPLRGIGVALEALGLPVVEVRCLVRTGDTPSSLRAAIARRPPQILVTTPESFYLLLTSESGRRLLRTVRNLIVDEIHAVADNRRGAHLALSIERLAALAAAPIQRIGLSATQRPIEEVARFLVGARGIGEDGAPRCDIIDEGHRRRLDLDLELPGAPLEAVMSLEVWDEVYARLVALIEAHRTTLVFVNTRRLAERLTQRLGERLGRDAVTSHHGSLSTALRLEAERRLKQGELRALVATASLEMGIDIGSVDLVCQIGSTRSIRAFLQRAGRAGHTLGEVPKARLFPLSRDELIECAALLGCVRRGELDALSVPRSPLDILAQQVVACAACEDWEEEALFALVRGAYPYRELPREDFDAVVAMLAEGFSTRRGRRGALIHHDAVNRRIRGRRGARLLALTSGGAIPENADYRVIVEPGETFIGTVNEDFAIESLPGDIFQLGNASWRIQRVHRGAVRVEDAQGRPPSIPFWLGEAPARTDELSRAVSGLRAEVESALAAEGTAEAAAARLQAMCGIDASAAGQIAEYLADARRLLGELPTRAAVVIERFFDESGGMQLVVHAPYGARVNRAWGLALRKRFCRSFNFELQAAANEDAIVLSLGNQHSFALEDVFRFLNARSVREVLVQALLDAPMFTTRWRWNAARALAVPRQRGGRRVPPPIQRMEAEDLIAAVFPDQLACLENISGDREIPDHPLVRQTIDDCLHEAMDVAGLEAALAGLESGAIRAVARDLPEPSPLAHEILTARPYAFLDDAPLEERRTQAVYARRALEPSQASDLGALDPEAIARVRAEAWPQAENADEVHDALVLTGGVAEDEARSEPDGASWAPQLEDLAGQRRAGTLAGAAPRSFWIAAERWPLWEAVFPGARLEPALEAPERCRRSWERPDAVRELVRGRLEASGPLTAEALARRFGIERADVEIALAALEGEGCILRGRFSPGAAELEWCDRRLLARIHRYTIERLRAEIEPVSAAEFLRFLFEWQRVAPGERAGGADGLRAVLEILDGFQAPAAAWETEILLSRLDDYDPLWLDGLCLSGAAGWGRLRGAGGAEGRAPAAGPVRSSPVALFLREHAPAWLAPLDAAALDRLSAPARLAFDALDRHGALFAAELMRRSELLLTQLESALGELVAAGLATSDSFAGLRALLVPARKRAPLASAARPRSRRLPGIDAAGRWSLLRTRRVEAPAAAARESLDSGSEAAIEVQARCLLRRYGVVFRKLLERESGLLPWRDLSRRYRTLEARGEIRGGRFVSGVSGEQFALPEAIGWLRKVRRSESGRDSIAVSAADPLNLVGIIVPGERVPALAANRVLFRGGEPIAALEGGALRRLAGAAAEPMEALEIELLRRRLPPALRMYY
jgi:ATP-dependent Lhr-like helicase